tara:strand:- start:2330 stop:3379 length:1050 start_codon:yes stop_codon:yes gene_type:complete
MGDVEMSAYYKRFPENILDATTGVQWTLETRGAYGLIIDLIFRFDGNLPDDPQYVAGLLKCSVRKWKSIREFLISEGKIRTEGGIISNKTADNLLEERRSSRDKNVENGRKGGKNRWLDKRTPKDSLKPRIEEEKNISPSSLRSEGVSPPDYDLALQAYHEIGDQLESRFGKRVWPRVQQFTQSRKSAVLQRVSEVGGLPEWREALERASRSSFLTGQNDRGWTPNFDFFCQQSSFTKLREGQYDDRKPTGGGAPTSRPKSGSRGRTFEDDLRDIAEERGWASGSDPQREQQHSGRVIDLARGDDGGFRAFDHRSADDALGDDAQSDRDGIEPEDDLAAIRQGVIKFSR